MLLRIRPLSAVYIDRFDPCILRIFAMPGQRLQLGIVGIAFSALRKDHLVNADVFGRRFL